MLSRQVLSRHMASLGHNEFIKMKILASITYARCIYDKDTLLVSAFDTWEIDRWLKANET